MPIYWTAGLFVRTETRVDVWQDTLVSEGAGEEDLVVLPGVVPSLDRRPMGFRPPWFAIRDDGFLCRYPGFVRLLASGGEAISFALEAPESDRTGDRLAQAIPTVLQSAHRAIISQRGGAALHASCVLFEGGAVAFCAPSGVGKSTLASSLMLRGRSVLADDKTVVVPMKGEWRVMPHERKIRLRPSSVDRLELQGLRLSRNGKSLLAMPTVAPGSRPRLRAIVFMQRRETSAPTSPQPLDKSAAVTRLDQSMEAILPTRASIDCGDQDRANQRAGLARSLASVATYTFTVPDGWRDHTKVLDGLEEFFDDAKQPGCQS